MILISKEEAFYLREKGRGVDIHISSRTHTKKYYLTESYESLKALRDYRNKRKVR